VIYLCDTGPLVGYLNRRDRYHAWSVWLFQQIRPPLLVPEAVVTEAVCFLREDGMQVQPLFELMERGILRVDFNLWVHRVRIKALLARYERMDLADASLVVMSEIHERSQVLTIDRRDFSTYRRHDRKTIDFVAP
jgi:uncharacterized protein